METTYDSTVNATYIYMCQCDTRNTREVTSSLGNTIMLDLAEDYHVTGVEILESGEPNSASSVRLLSEVEDILRNRHTHSTRSSAVSQ